MKQQQQLGTLSGLKYREVLFFTTDMATPEPLPQRATHHSRRLRGQQPMPPSSPVGVVGSVATPPFLRGPHLLPLYVKHSPEKGHPSPKVLEKYYSFLQPTAVHALLPLSPSLRELRTTQGDWEVSSRCHCPPAWIL